MLVLGIDQDSRFRRHELRRASHSWSRRPTARRPSPPGSRGRRARRGSADRPHPMRRSTPEPRHGRRVPRARSRAGLRARPGEARLRRTSTCPRHAARRLARGGGRSCAPRARRDRGTGSVADQPTSARASKESRGEKRSRSTPQSTTSVFAAASGTASASRSRSQFETATIADARRTTCRVANRVTGFVRAFSTSCPCAVATSGARDASAPRRPAGTRKCA